MRLSPFKIRVIIMNVVFLTLFLGMRVAQKKGEAQCTPYVPVLCDWNGTLNFNGDNGSKDYIFTCVGGAPGAPGVLTQFFCTNC